MHTVRPSSLCPSFGSGESDVGMFISSSFTVEFVDLVATIWPKSTDLRSGAPLYTGAEVSAVAILPSA